MNCSALKVDNEPRIKLLARGLDVAPLQTSLAAHPELWDTITSRTADPASPHYGCSDIWARFAPAGAGGDIPHVSVWYPAAATLTGLREFVWAVFDRFQGIELGGVLITRIPPGGEVRPHRDIAWHANKYTKVAVSIHAAPKQTFCFDRDQLETEPGDVFWFDNSYTHSVTNQSNADRVTLVICMTRRDGGPHDPPGGLR